MKLAKDNGVFLFIIGAPRSGTTLLRLLLTSHPAICIPPESPFLIYMEKKFGIQKRLSDNVGKFLNELYKDKKFTEWGIEKKTLELRLKAEVSLTYSKAITIIYQAYALITYPDAYILGDKNPSYLYHIETLLKYFPRAKIIHIIRDIRGIYNSSKNKSLTKNEQFNNEQLLSITRYWQQAERVTEKYRTDARVYTLHYENLVSSPGGQLKDIFAWIGVEYSDSVLNFYEENASKKLVPENRHGWHYRTLQPITDKQIDAWKTELKKSEIEILELLNKRRMQKWGYVHVTSFPLWKGISRLVVFFCSILKNTSVFQNRTKNNKKVLS